MTWIAPELETMLAVVAARLDANGKLLAANAGFLGLLESDGLPILGTPIAHCFVQPDFLALVGAVAGTDGLIHHGLLTIGAYMGRRRALRGRVWRDGTGFRLLAEYDVEGLEHLTDTVIQLNSDYANSQLQLSQTNIKVRQLNAELEQREQALKASEFRWRFALEGSGDGLWDWDLVGGTVFFTKQLKEMLGLSGDEVSVGSDEWLDRIHPDDRQATDGAVQAALRGAAPIALEVRVRCEDGSYKWMLNRGMVAARGDDGQAVRMIGTLEDITERKRAQEALAHESRRNEIFLRHAGDGVHILDAGGNVLEVSNSFCEMLGYPRDELIGTHVSQWDAQWSPPELRQMVANHLAKDGATVLETRLRRRDGSTLDAEVTIQPFQLDGQPMLFGSARDTTRRVQIVADLRKLSRAVEQSPASILITDRTAHIEYVNARFEQVTGYTQAEVSGQNPRLLQSGRTPPETYAEMWKAISDGGEWRGELCNRRKNGELFWEHASISGLADEHGQVTHYIAVKEDITQRKLAEESLQQFRSAMDAIAEAIFFVDRETMLFVEVNRACCDMLQYTREELLEMRVTDVVRPTPEQLEAVYDSVIAGTPNDRTESAVRRKGGTVLVVEVSRHAERIGTKWIIVGVARDITDRKQIEAELEQHRHHLEALVRARTAELEAAHRRTQEIQFAMDKVGINILWADVATSRVVYANEAVESLLGYTADEVLRLTVPDLDPTVTLASFTELMTAIRDQGRAEFESVLRSKDGRLTPVTVMLHYSKGNADMPPHSIAFMRDVSERKAAEAALAQAGEAAEAARRAAEERVHMETIGKMESRKLEAVGTLAAGMAHEFNNILGSIIGFAEMTVDDLPDDSRPRRNVEKIRRAGFRARDLVARVLTFASPGVSALEPVNVVAQVREALAMLGASLPSTVSLSFQSTIDEGNPLATIRAESTKIQQIVMNLCINAAHAINGIGEVRVALDAADTLAGSPAGYRNGICLRVTDTGGGMTPEVLERMFDPFFTTKEPGQGTGLGLSVVKAIVTELVGAIEVESRVSGINAGTEFRIFLPAGTDRGQPGEPNAAYPAH